MKKLLFLIPAFLLISFISSGQNTNKDLQESRDIYSEAFKNSDVETILKVYSDDAVVHHLDGTLYTGSNEIRNLYEEFFQNSEATVGFENVSEDKLSDDLIFYHDKVFLDIKGEEETRNIEVVNVAQKINGKWRVIKSYRWPKP